MGSACAGKAQGAVPHHAWARQARAPGRTTPLHPRTRVDAGSWQRRPPRPGRLATAASTRREASANVRPGGQLRTQRRQSAWRWHHRGSMIRHASPQPQAVGALPIAMVQPTEVAALVLPSRSSRADGTGSGAARVPAVRLASVVLLAHEERCAAPAAREHHENVLHAPQRSPPALHRRPQVAGLPPGPPSTTGTGVAARPGAPRRYDGQFRSVKKFGGTRDLHQIYAHPGPHRQPGPSPVASAAASCQHNGHGAGLQTLPYSPT